MAAYPAAGRSSWFFRSMAVLLLVIVFAGFAPTYYLRTDDKPALAPLYMIHGAVFTAWFALFLVQSMLIASRRVKIHRILGWASLGLVPPMLTSGILVGLDALRRGVAAPPFGAETFFFFSVSDMAGFAVLYGLGVWARRAHSAHKRLMLFAAISLVLPAAGRIADSIGLGPAGAGLQIALCISVAGYDLVTRRTIHWATWTGGLLVAAKLLGIVTIGTSAWWLSVAAYWRDL